MDIKKDGPLKNINQLFNEKENLFSWSFTYLGCTFFLSLLRNSLPELSPSGLKWLYSISGYSQTHYNKKAFDNRNNKNRVDVFWSIYAYSTHESKIKCVLALYVRYLFFVLLSPIPKQSFQFLFVKFSLFTCFVGFITKSFTQPLSFFFFYLDLILIWFVVVIVFKIWAKVIKRLRALSKEHWPADQTLIPKSTRK